MEPNIAFEVLSAALSSAGISGMPLSTAAEEWNAALSRCDYVPVFYSRSSIAYQFETQQRLGGAWQDISMILSANGTLCGVWPMTVRTCQDNAVEISSQGLPLLAPLLVGSIGTERKSEIDGQCLAALLRLKEATSAKEITFSDSNYPPDALGISSWHEALLSSAAASVAVEHDLYVDLRQPMDSIFANYRSRFKSLVRKAADMWSADIVESDNPAIWSEFKSLHLEVAGRATRSDRSWGLQRQSLADGNSLLITLRDQGRRLIGGGYFEFTQNEGQYSVGAYDRSLYDSPVSHLVQHLAIERFHQMGISWYRIGRRPYPGDMPAPTEKEMSIGHFKEGFATHMFPRYLLRI